MIKKILITLSILIIGFEIFVPKVVSCGSSIFRCKLIVLDSKTGEKLDGVVIDYKNIANLKTDKSGSRNLMLSAGYSRYSSLLVSRKSASIRSQTVTLTKEGYQERSFIIPKRKFKWYFSKPKLSDIIVKIKKNG